MDCVGGVCLLQISYSVFSFLFLSFFSISSGALFTWIFMHTNTQS